MTAENVPTAAEIANRKNVGDLFEIIAATEYGMSGMFDAFLNRGQAQALASAGYSLKPGEKNIGEGSIFDLLITVENQNTGMFRAAVAREVTKSLVAAGCSF